MLHLNGIDLSEYIAEGTWEERSTLKVGGRRRAFAGGMRDDTVLERRAWTCRTVPLSREITDAIRGLLHPGQLGDAFSFDADKWSSRGDVFAGGTSAVSATQSKYGGAALNVTAGAPACTLEALSEPAWAVAGWQYTGGVWVHRMITASGAKYLAGVSDAGSPGWSVAAGVLSLSTSPGWFDDLIILPFEPPASWALQIYTAAATGSLAPWHKLTATGELTGARTLRGEVVGATSFAMSESGSVTVTGESLDLLFEEY